MFNLEGKDNISNFGAVPGGDLCKIFNPSGFHGSPEGADEDFLHFKEVINEWLQNGGAFHRIYIVINGNKLRMSKMDVRAIWLCFGLLGYDLLFQTSKEGHRRWTFEPFCGSKHREQMRIVVTHMDHSECDKKYWETQCLLAFPALRDVPIYFTGLSELWQNGYDLLQLDLQNVKPSSAVFVLPPLFSRWKAKWKVAREFLAHEAVLKEDWKKGFAEESERNLEGEEEQNLLSAWQEFHDAQFEKHFSYLQLELDFAKSQTVQELIYLVFLCKNKYTNKGFSSTQ